ncbi:MAG TPA: hypothetical protein VIL84_04080 [Devosiaceae bacterium]
MPRKFSTRLIVLSSLALAIAPAIALYPMTTDQAMAANAHSNANGKSGESHGQAPDHSSAGGNSANAGNSVNNSSVAALHAAHANLQAFIHASPNSRVGKLAIYAQGLATLWSAQDAYNAQLAGAQTAFETFCSTDSYCTGSDLADVVNAFASLQSQVDAGQTLSAADQAQYDDLSTFFGTGGAGADLLSALVTLQGTSDPTPLLLDAYNKDPSLLTQDEIDHVDQLLLNGGVLAQYGYTPPT